MTNTPTPRVDAAEEKDRNSYEMSREVGDPHFPSTNHFLKTEAAKLEHELDEAKSKLKEAEASSFRFAQALKDSDEIGDQLRKELEEAKIHKRCIMCPYCGDTIYKYTEPANHAEAVAACCKHDAQCSSNPIVAERDQLARQLDEWKKCAEGLAMAMKEDCKLHTHIKPTGCDFCNGLAEYDRLTKEAK